MAITPSNTVIVTGGAGFIGSSVIRQMFAGQPDLKIINLDAMTYAANELAVEDARHSDRYRLEKLDIRDGEGVRELIDRVRPKAIVHLAAESHVDRSIERAKDFVETNVLGTFHLLEAAMHYWRGLESSSQEAFRFLHVSTDEVYGDLGPEGEFTEDSRYEPNSPYAASKAASDHFVRAYHRTHGLPVVLTNCSNNYGPYQYPEKLIPVMIYKGLKGEKLPVYGSGQQVRDWIFVDDHARAILMALEAGEPGRGYNVGSRNERTNMQIVELICSMLDELAPNPEIGPRRELITHVQDRPGHDFRYAINPERVERELGWKPYETFESGMRKTVQWYVDRRDEYLKQEAKIFDYS